MSSYCVYCSSVTHTSEACRAPHKAQTMVSLYGATTVHSSSLNPPPVNPMSAYAQAVEQDRLFTQELLKNMSPEQVNRFCFENGFSVPVRTTRQDTSTD